MSRSKTKAAKNPTAKPRKAAAAARKTAAATRSKAGRLNAGRPSGGRSNGGRSSGGAGASSRPKPRFFDRVRPRTALRAGGGAVLLVAALWAWQSGFVGRQVDQAVDSLLRTTADLGLKVGNVHVVGRHHTSSEEILATLGVKQGEPLLGFDPHAARERLESLAWVQTASVERRLPDLIHVTLVEREALALWQLEGALQVIDAEGRVIPDADPADFAGLPMVVGEGAEREAKELFRLLDSEPYLRTRVEAAVRVGTRRWNLRLQPGIDVRLPEEGALEAWQTLARLDREDGLLSRDLVVIDMRQPDRLLVRPSPGVVVEPPSPLLAGEDT